MSGIPSLLLPAHSDPDAYVIRTALMDAIAVRSDQMVAADLTNHHLPPYGAVDQAKVRRLAFFEVTLGTAFAADETMQFTISRLRAGVTQAIAVILLDATIITETGNTAYYVREKLSDQYEFVAGDILVLARDYTAGGGPSGTSTLVRIIWK